MTASSTNQLRFLPTGSKRLEANSRLWISSPGQWLLMAICLCVTWIFSATHALVHDEAYYWTWSRRLAISYFDHPPMVAYLIRLGTAIAGTSEFGVRWPAAIVILAGVWILIRASRDLIPHEKTRSFVAVMLLTSPLVYTLACIITPDTPTCFFQSIALACILRIFRPESSSSSRQNRALWIVFGLLMGLALDSKYTAVLLGFSVLLAMLSCPVGRQQLKTPWPWAAALAAAMAFSPVVIWNARHDWASFRFQINHGLGNAAGYSAIRGLADYIPGQMMIATPVLFVLGMIVLFDHCRKPRTDVRLRILAIATAAPIIFFAISSLRRRVEGNWPCFAYLPMILLVGHYFSENWTRRNAVWARNAAFNSIGFTIVLLCAPWVWIILPRFNIAQLNDLYGWRELAAIVQSHRVSNGNSQEIPVTAMDYHYASEMAFYLPDRPMVWSLPDLKRPTEFDYVPGRTRLADLQRVIVVGGPIPSGEPQVNHQIANNFTNVQVIRVPQTQFGHQIRESRIYIGSK